MSGHTLLDRIWDSHVVSERPGHPSVLYVDLHLVHEVTSPQAFAELHRRDLEVRRPTNTLATIDHAIPTVAGGLRNASAAARNQISTLEHNCARHGIELHGLESPEQGIVHVIGPELGRTQPGMTVVCGDSHTSTHGAFGCLAFGIGTSEVAQVLATQCLLRHRPQAMRVTIDGKLDEGVTAKDLALALIAKIGADGGRGFVIEYAGEAVRDLDMEGRMTLCNLSIEAGARGGLIAPDATTSAWLDGRLACPSGPEFDTAKERWESLRSDPAAEFSKEVRLDASRVEPWVTWGTQPAMGGPVDAPVPDPGELPASNRVAAEQAQRYMDVVPGRALVGVPVDTVFVGSCTNGRLGDLRAAARVLRRRQVAHRVRMVVVPGSRAVKRAAEAEGLDVVFREAGAEWREPGCSMCIAMNGDRIEAGAVCVSTSNRNFEGRQGRLGRTILASPLTAAASAVAGAVADPRPFLGEHA
ncbi:MAG: 3-isopropylmalate dehydratase large subunit [Planctomycetes bacterium]|nr:3-isopropylmalate dehydratase large subunit [Planctomycetota bacterium]